MRRRKRNPTPVERLINQLEALGRKLNEAEVEPESDDEILQQLLRDQKVIEREIARHRKDREEDKVQYRQLEKEYDALEAQIKKLDPEFDGL